MAPGSGAESPEEPGARIARCRIARRKLAGYFSFLTASPRSTTPRLGRPLFVSSLQEVFIPMFSGPVRGWMVAILVLPGCLQIPGFAQTTLTTPLDEQQIRTPVPKEETRGTPAVDPRVPLTSPDPNSMESAPGKDKAKDRLPGQTERLAVPEKPAR